MLNKPTLTLSALLALTFAVFTTQVSASHHPMVKEYYLYGENQPLIQLLQANLGVSFGAYRGLLQRDTPQFREDECYRDLWEVANVIISSFNVIGRGFLIQNILTGTYAAELIYRSYVAGSVCIPLFYENQPAFTPMVPSDVMFYIEKSYKILQNTFVTLFNADGFGFYNNVTEIIFQIIAIVERLTK